MNYREAREFINQISVRGIEPGLAAVTNLLAELGNPQDQLKFIHVAGTNGKGSVLAYVSSVLQESGYRVGRYISPTLFSYRERIQVNGNYIEREAFARLVTRVADAMDIMERQGLGAPTVFEAETAVSFLYFLEQGCDIVLLEVGMGGRLDATNVIRTPVLTVLAPVSMDHMAYLGNTLGEIAYQKAGIFKPGVPAVSAHQQPEAEAVIREAAQETGCTCEFVDPGQFRDVNCGLERQQFTYGTFRDVTISLAGAHQVENAALALLCTGKLRSLGYAIPDRAVYDGLRKTQWRGRFTVVHRDPVVVLDGAHNPDAARRLRDAVEVYFAGRRKYFIFGVFSDKEYDKIIEITAGLAEHIITVQTPGNPRALPAEELAEAVRRVNPSVEPAASVADAVQRSFALAGKEDVILVFGSLSFLGVALKAVETQEAGAYRDKMAADDMP